MSESALRPGHVAVVTGAASGIGAALAAGFASAGGRVVMADVERSALEQAGDRVRAGGAEVLTVVTDVADADSVSRLAQATVDHFGQVDVLCNNAGVSTFNRLADQTLADWRWVLGVNLWGVVHGVHTFVPIMRQQGTPAHIVNTSSIAGLWSGVSYIGPYAVSKVGVVSLSETLHAELKSEKAPIGVSVLCPSSVGTNVMEAERNRPESFGREERTETAEQVRLMIRVGLFGADGKTADEVAAMTLDAIRRDRFWIITHASGRPGRESPFEKINADLPDA